LNLKQTFITLLGFILISIYLFDLFLLSIRYGRRSTSIAGR
jgi:hypothetical protein